MKKIYWSYNPYTLTSEFLVDDKKPTHTSDLYKYVSSGVRMQDHIWQIPEELEKNYNDKNFEITFCGTKADFSDICDIFCGETYTLFHEEVDESKDIEKQIDDLFKEILNGPLDELKDNKIKSAYDTIKNNELDISVIAPMSAGKSTLINAMLGESLMPSQARACTAIITKIKDCDKNHWDATIYYKDGVCEKKENISIDDMKAFNKDENVDEIIIEGDIPFVTTEETSLVLIDTPGPNNARNEEHGNIQRNFINKSSKSLVLYVLDNSFENSANANLLEEIAEAMKINGKQSKDRFIFVLNKVDDIDIEDDEPIGNTLEDIREYLESQEIENPRIFPVSARQALLLRKKKAGKLSDLSSDHLKINIFKKDAFFLEKYAPLPKNIRNILDNNMINMAEEEQILVHTGIVSLEEYIKLFLNKYAKTIKVKKIVDEFRAKLNELEVEETIKNRLNKDENERKNIIRYLDDINSKVSSGFLAKRFVNDEIPQISKSIREELDKKINKMKITYSKELRKIIEKYSDKTAIDSSKAADIVEDLKKKVKSLLYRYKYDIKEFVKNIINDTERKIEDNYKKLLSNLSSEMDNEEYKFNINISQLIDIDIKDNYDELIKKYTNIENVFKWYDIRTWFGSEKEVVDFGKLAQEHFEKLETVLNESLYKIKSYIDSDAENLVMELSSKIEEIDKNISDKMEILRRYGEDADKLEENIVISKCNLEWITHIQKKLNDILELKKINI